MGLKIKKTEKLSIEELKTNTKAYDKISLNINREKFEEYKKDYGVSPFSVLNDYSILINDKTIEFLPKAVKIYSDGCGSAVSIPYEFIDEVECIRYLTTEK